MSLRSSLLIYGALLIGGGLGWWYIQTYGCPDWMKSWFPFCPGDGNGVACEGHTNQINCISAGCFWYNNSCHRYPQSSYCQGTCFYEGAKGCDQQNNLCICENGEWKLFQENAPECISGETHLDCFPSQNNIATCIPQPGLGTSTCWRPGYSAGCSCAIHECDTFHFCEPSDYRCILKAANSSIYGEKSTSEHWLYIPFAEPLAASGTFSTLAWYQNAAPIDVINWSLWAEYNGEEVMLKDGVYTSSGESGWFLCPEQPLVFTPQGIDMIKLHMDSAISNVNPRSWQGILTY